MKTKNIIIITVFGILIAVFAVRLYKTYSTSRWYTQKQVVQGKKLFLANCAVCHGKVAQKTVNWKKTLADGSYPPPPLNGTAHAWHHPKSMLKEIVANGGTLYGGKMPPFKDILSENERDSVIAFFQNFWSDKIYSAWKKNGGLTK